MQIRINTYIPISCTRLQKLRSLSHGTLHHDHVFPLHKNRTSICLWSRWDWYILTWCYIIHCMLYVQHDHVCASVWFRASMTASESLRVYAAPAAHINNLFFQKLWHDWVMFSKHSWYHLGDVHISGMGSRLNKQGIIQKVTTMRSNKNRKNATKNFQNKKTFAFILNTHRKHGGGRRR